MKKKIKILFTVFMFITMLCFIDDVYANQGCTYKLTYLRYNPQKYYSAITNGTELPEPIETIDYKIAIGMKENGELFSSVAQVAYTQYNPSISIPKDYISSLFVKEQDESDDKSTTVLYCPTKVYLNQDNTFGGYSLSTKERKNVTKMSGKVSYLLVDPKTEGGAQKYEPGTSGEELVKCISGGKKVANEYETKINSYKTQLNGINKNTVDKSDKLLTIQKEVKQISAEVSNKIKDGYCNVDAFNSLSSLINETDAEIKKKMNEVGVDEATKEKIELNSEAISTLSRDISEFISSTQSSLGNFKIEEGNILNCEELLDDDLKDVIKLVLNVLKIAVPILLIVLVTIDFATAVISQDQDSIKKATSKAIKRGIAALAFFFIPMFINIMLDWLLRYSPITVTRMNEEGNIEKIEMSDVSCEEVLKG